MTSIDTVRARASRSSNFRLLEEIDASPWGSALVDHLLRVSSVRGTRSSGPGTRQDASLKT
jgi:hypothetical protein